MIQFPVEIFYTIWSVLLSGFLWMLRTLATDQRAQRSIALVTGAGLRATSYALTTARTEVSKAMRPESDGGVRITPEEWKTIIKQAVGAGWQFLERAGPGVLHQAVDLYGGEDAVREAIVNKVTESLKEKGYKIK